VSPRSAVRSPQSREPAEVLSAIASELRAERTVLSAHVVDPGERPQLGMLVAAGPRCRAAPGEYARVVESVREGYLLHYGAPRLLAGADGDLALLAGDHLYALGLARLAALDDLEAIRELSDLISLCAELHAHPSADQEVAAALWLASVVAVAVGPSAAHDSAKDAVRARRPGTSAALREAARSRAEEVGLAEPLRRCAEAIESSADDDSR
jgi:hypothetical protein